MQTEVPDGYTTDGTNCYPPVVDVCSNIDDVQTEVPEGYTADDGECLLAPAGSRCRLSGRLYCLENAAWGRAARV